MPATKNTLQRELQRGWHLYRGRAFHYGGWLIRFDARRSRNNAYLDILSVGRACPRRQPRRFWNTTGGRSNDALLVRFHACRPFEPLSTPVSGDGRQSIANPGARPVSDVPETGERLGADHSGRLHRGGPRTRGGSGVQRRQLRSEHQTGRVPPQRSPRALGLGEVWMRQVDWFVLRGGRYERLEPDDRGGVEGLVFPGLWLDTAALLRGDLAGMLHGIDEDLANGRARRLPDATRQCRDVILVNPQAVERLGLRPGQDLKIVDASNPKWSRVRLPTLSGQPVQMFLPGVLNRLRGVKTFKPTITRRRPRRSSCTSFGSWRTAWDGTRRSRAIWAALSRSIPSMEALRPGADGVIRKSAASSLWGVELMREHPHRRIAARCRPKQRDNRSASKIRERARPICLSIGIWHDPGWSRTADGDWSHEK